MASSEVDQKLLGRLAKAVERDNPILGQVLFKILGLSLNLARQLLLAKRMRPRPRPRQRLRRPILANEDAEDAGVDLGAVHEPRLDPDFDLDLDPDPGNDPSLDPARLRPFLDLAYHVIWLSREGLNLLEQYVLPWVGHDAELIVLAHKLRASFLHVYVLFYNQPAVSRMNVSDPDIVAAARGMRHPVLRFQAPAHSRGGASANINTAPQSSPSPASFQERKRHGTKGKRTLALYDDDLASTRSSLQPTHPLEGGPVAAQSHAYLHSHSRSQSRSYSPSPSPTFPYTSSSPPPAPLKPFVVPRLIQEANYLPTAHVYFLTAVQLANELLWGSHSLRLSVKTEYAAFLYECMHDPDASRRLARDTITEVYEAQEGMDDDMFEDACQLVAVLGRMKKRGQSQARKPAPAPALAQQPQPQPQPQPQASTQRQAQAQAQVQTPAQTHTQVPGRQRAQQRGHNRRLDVSADNEGAASSPQRTEYGLGYGLGYGSGYGSLSDTGSAETPVRPTLAPPPGMENAI